MKRLAQFGLTLAAALVMGVMPVQAGSAAVGSIAGSRNATLSGAVLVPNTTVFSGDQLQVREGVAVVALDAGNRMVFGRQTEASFERGAKDVTVLLSRGNVSMYHPGASLGVAVKAGDVTVRPAAGYKTLGVWGAYVFACAVHTYTQYSEGRERGNPPEPSPPFPYQWRP